MSKPRSDDYRGYGIFPHVSDGSSPPYQASFALVKVHKDGSWGPVEASAMLEDTFQTTGEALEAANEAARRHIDELLSRPDSANEP